MSIDQLSLTELKALVYDLSRQINQLQANINVVESEITRREQEQTEQAKVVNINANQ